MLLRIRLLIEMCTVTFVPKSNGYLLAMNRDESRARDFALAPAKHFIAAVSSLYPHEPAGGTWIALNEYGCAFALLNRSVPSSASKCVSRGIVVPQMIAAASVERARELFSALVLDGMLPFRLVGLFPSDCLVLEWQWDGIERTHLVHVWSPRHWYSSGLGDNEAELHRSAVSRRSWSESDSGSLQWLRRFHASHDPEPGAFSVCVHRYTAATLSYTEICVDEEQCMMRYAASSPCKLNGFSAELSLPRVPESTRVFR